MKRHAEDHLNHWFAKPKRKPLVIRGARQVGKSTLVRNFAASHNLNLVEVNLEKHKNLNKLFETKNIREVCREIEFLTGVELNTAGGKLLFLDEIQATPEAIPCLRYFYEEFPRLAVISAGSLLEFALSDHSFSMPVGRIEYLYLGPVNFIEFLEAQEQTKLIDLILGFKWGDVFPTSAHTQLCALLRDFFLVGGMPEATSSFVDSEDFNDVTDIHLSIIDTYQDDFAKYARHSQLSMMQNVFNHVPQTVGNKVKYSNIDPYSQAREIKTAIELLIKAGVLTRVNHSNAAGLPLGAGINPKIYKLYFLDIGLLNTMCGTKHISLETLRNAHFVNEGNVAEQFMAQSLLYSGRPNNKPELFYWLREGRASNAEVDFVIPMGSEILPVEVNAGKSGRLKSLQQFVNRKDCRNALRFDLNIPSRQDVEYSLPDNCKVRFELTSLPLYMVNRCDLCF